MKEYCFFIILYSTVLEFFICKESLKLNSIFRYLMQIHNIIFHKSIHFMNNKCAILFVLLFASREYILTKSTICYSVSVRFLSFFWRKKFNICGE